MDDGSTAAKDAYVADTFGVDPSTYPSAAGSNGDASSDLGTDASNTTGPGTPPAPDPGPVSDPSTGAGDTTAGAASPGEGADAGGSTAPGDQSGSDEQVAIAAAPDGGVAVPDGPQGHKITGPTCFRHKTQGVYKTMKPGDIPGGLVIEWDFVHDGPCQCEGKTADECQEPGDGASSGPPSGDPLAADPVGAAGASNDALALSGGAAGAPDAGAPGAGAKDAGAPNASGQDGGTPDGGAPAAGTPDAGAPPAGPSPDGGAPPPAAQDAGAAPAPVTTQVTAPTPTVAPLKHEDVVRVWGADAVANYNNAWKGGKPPAPLQGAFVLTFPTIKIDVGNKGNWDFSILNQPTVALAVDKGGLSGQAGINLFQAVWKDKYGPRIEVDLQAAITGLKLDENPQWGGNALIELKLNSSVGITAFLSSQADVKDGSKSWENNFSGGFGIVVHVFKGPEDSK